VVWKENKAVGSRIVLVGFARARSGDRRIYGCFSPGDRPLRFFRGFHKAADCSLGLSSCGISEPEYLFKLLIINDLQSFPQFNVLASPCSLLAACAGVAFYFPNRYISEGSGYDCNGGIATGYANHPRCA
jgi:hypothetical protein